MECRRTYSDVLQTSGLSMSLVRYLKLPSPSQNSGPVTTIEFSDELESASFRGAEYTLHPGAEGTAQLVIKVPHRTRGVRGGPLETGDEDNRDLEENGSKRHMESLFEIVCTLVVKISMGFGAKDIVLELPVVVAHPAALRGIVPSDRYPSPERLVSPAPETYGPPLAPSPPQTYATQSPPPMPYSPENRQYQLPHIPLYPSPPTSPPMHPHMYMQSPPPFAPDQLATAQPWIQPPQYHAYDMQPSPVYSANGVHNQYYFPPVPSHYPYLGRPVSTGPQVRRQLPPLPIHKGQLPIESTLIRDEPKSPKMAEVQGYSLDDIAEPGQGERASRISMRLHESSRNRSVSPNAHRFVYQESPPRATALDVSLDSPGGHSSSHLLVSPIRSGDANAEVLSPRPILSPRTSFVDPTSPVGSVPKSERVEALERMAAEVVENDELELSKQRSSPRSLPGVPAPTDLDPNSDGNILDLHAASSDGGTPRLPPQPTLAPVTPMSRPTLRGREGGLDALERKLLEQVGTRKPETERRPDVRSVMPIEIPRTNDPRCEPSIHSAISSLQLGDISGDSIDILASLSEAKPKPVDTPIVAGREKIDKGESPHVEGRAYQGERKPPEKKSNHRHKKKAATGRVAAWLGAIDPSEPPPPSETPPTTSPKVAVEDLKPLEYDPHPLLKSSRSHLRLSVQATDDPEQSGAEEVVSDTPFEQEPIEHLAIPTRSSGFLLHGQQQNDDAVQRSNTATPKPPVTDGVNVGNEDKVHAELPVFKQLDVPLRTDGLTKYDIRSARGGRGGQVTSVAAIWSSLASQQEVSSNLPKRKDVMPRKPRVTMPTVAENHAFKADLPLTNVNKAVSVPAVLSSSLAIPVLSSTASLARPISSDNTRPIPLLKPDFLKESNLIRTSDKHPQHNAYVSKDLVFGQARLKDLIKKYQGQ